MKHLYEQKELEVIERRHHEKQIWTRFGTFLLGLWLLWAPATFGYQRTLSGKVEWAFGLLLIFFGIISISYRFRYWIWGGALIGVLLQFLPLVLWAARPVIYLNETLVGVIALSISILVPLRPKELEIGPEIPPGWTYNPSTWHQRIPVVFMATLAWFLSRYLASFQLGYISTVFDPFFGMGSEKVISSMISQRFPISDAGLGALVYSLEAILGAKGGVRRWHTLPWTVLGFGFLVVPAGFVSILLIMSQPIVVGAWCGICVITAVLMLFMLALTVDEVVATLQFLKRERKGRSLFKLFFLGSHYHSQEVDVRNPGFHAPLSRIFKAMLWGVTAPWNLTLLALGGVWLLFSDNVYGYGGWLAKNIDVIGALLVVFSIIAFAEVLRSLRFLNILLALWLALISWLAHPSKAILIHNLIAALLIILLTLPKGRVKELYGRWNRAIF